MKISGYRKYTAGPALSVTAPTPEPLPCSHSKETKAWGTMLCVRCSPGEEKPCCKPESCKFYVRDKETQ